MGAGRKIPCKSRRDSGFRRNDVDGKRKSEDGFTLVELMVVIVIIGLLATVVVINVMPAQDTARVKKAEADIALLEQAAEMYRLSRLNYPTGEQGLQALVAEGFVKRLPDDPWGNAYRYTAPGRNGAPFDIYSLGADNAEGGEGDDADIGTWAN
ncbi:type II secretion system major pseudopilin GspG [Allosphingosinicella vermicomposti]|uniref:type II secretion system major pseudopilin GspG n=1 Tax=Allosphingosinicella vermicomposti TaxID=614671 RepID=UPI003CC92305